MLANVLIFICFYIALMSHLCAFDKRHQTIEIGEHVGNMFKKKKTFINHFESTFEPFHVRMGTVFVQILR